MFKIAGISDIIVNIVLEISNRIVLVFPKSEADEYISGYLKMLSTTELA